MNLCNLWLFLKLFQSKILIRNSGYNRFLIKKLRKGTGLLAVLLPKKSPWLNPIEPRWVHAKRKVVEPERKLSAKELSRRVCAVFDQPVLPWITNSKNTVWLCTSHMTDYKPFSAIRTSTERSNKDLRASVSKSLSVIREWIFSISATS